MSPDQRSRKTHRKLPNTQPQGSLASAHSSTACSSPVPASSGKVRPWSLSVFRGHGKGLALSLLPALNPFAPFPMSLAQRPSSLAPEFPSPVPSLALHLGPCLSSAHTGPKPRLAGSCFSSGPSGARHRGLESAPGRGNSQSKALAPAFLQPPGARPRQPPSSAPPVTPVLRLPCFFCLIGTCGLGPWVQCFLH